MAQERYVNVRLTYSIEKEEQDFAKCEEHVMVITAKERFRDVLSNSNVKAAKKVLVIYYQNVIEINRIKILQLNVQAKWNLETAREIFCEEQTTCDVRRTNI